MRITCRAVGLLAIVGLAGITGPNTTPVDAAVDGMPQAVRLPGLDPLAIRPTAAPSIAMLSTADNSDAGRFDLDDVRLLPVAQVDGDLQLRRDGRTAWRVTSKNRFELLDVETGAVTASYTVPWTTDWTLGGVGATDPTGRYIALDASSGLYAAERAFLFDTATQTLLTPDPQGIGLGDQHRSRSISADAAIVEYVEWDWLSDQYRTLRWDRTTDVRTDLGRRPLAGSTSSDGNWSVDVRDEQWIRRNERTGTTVVIPVDATKVRYAAVYNGGRVVVAHVVATPTNPQSVQISSWDGSGTLRLLSRAANGEPANMGAVDMPPFAANADASRVAFVSFSDNLSPRLPAPAPARLFVVTLPASVLPSQLPASGRICMPAVGARRGDVVAVNLTPVRAAARGYGTMHPAGSAVGGTSNVNFRPGSVDPNVAFVEVGAYNEICFTNSPDGRVDVIVDELLVADGAVFSAPTPQGASRTADTRRGLGGSRLAPGERRCVASNAAPGHYVAVNVTAVRATGRGYGTLHSSDTAAGDSSTVNYDVDSVDPNLAIVQVGADGRVCFTNSAGTSVDLLLDELATAGPMSFSLPTADGARRLVDTRHGLGGGTLAAGERRCVATVGTAPGDWVAVNATPVRATTRGFGTLHSSDTAAGSTSNVNFDVGTIDPNLAIVQVGADRRICFTNSRDGRVDLILDQQMNATAATFRNPVPRGAYRLIDTRTLGS